MSSTAKLIYGLLAIFIIALGVEGYLYFQYSKNLKTSSSQTQPNTGNPTLVEVTGTALVGNLNLFDITKDQVGNWAKYQGSIEVPAYSGPIPIPPSLVLQPEPSAAGTFTPRPSSVKVAAGYFKSTTSDSITFSQGGKDITIIFNPEIHLWTKEEGKVQMVSNKIGNLLQTGNFKQLVKLNDLVLASNIKEYSGQLQAQSLIVFR